jgi:hypothetical protein
VRRLVRRLFGGPPDEEDALVPLHPRRPLGSGSVALDLPEQPQDVDARDRETG